jgi:ABC-2 type transport system ATP-binding protein
MPESPGLYLRLSVAENLQCFADLYEVPDAKGRIGQALQAVKLAGRADDPCGTLSKGLRQRVALARALLSDPQVLFLDEPTSGLDPAAARDVHELVDGLRQRGVTIFLTTHRLEEAERLCDRVAILNTTLRTIGRPDELRDRLFAKTLTVKTLAPLREPRRVFAGIPAVDNWRLDGTASYVLAVSDMAGPRPPLPGRLSPPVPTCCPSPSRITRWRTSISNWSISTGKGPDEVQPKAGPCHRQQGATRVPPQRQHHLCDGDPPADLP